MQSFVQFIFCICVIIEINFVASLKNIMTEEQLIDGLHKLGTIDNARAEQVFKYIVGKYQSVIFNTCIGIVHEHDDAKDISQEVFVQLYKSAADFRGDSKISTWLYRIAVNKSLNFIRNNKKHKAVMSFERSSSADDTRQLQIKDQKSVNPQIIQEQQEHKQALKIAIDSLPENQKTAFVLKNFDDNSYKEITEIMEMSLSSVESLIHRAKKNLQKSLKYYYENNIL